MPQLVAALREHELLAEPAQGKVEARGEAAQRSTREPSWFSDERETTTDAQVIDLQTERDGQGQNRTVDTRIFSRSRPDDETND